jgi:organic hydroperoxide reductase OsmC/OhrA
MRKSIRGPLTQQESIMSIEKVLYQARAKATGGRDGRAVSSDGVLDVQLTKPRPLRSINGDELSEPQQ